MAADDTPASGARKKDRRPQAPIRVERGTEGQFCSAQARTASPWADVSSPAPRMRFTYAVMHDWYAPWLAAPASHRLLEATTFAPMMMPASFTTSTPVSQSPMRAVPELVFQPVSSSRLAEMSMFTVALSESLID